MLQKPKHINLMLILIMTGMLVFGRESATLYSIGDNAVWSLSTSWSLSADGPASGLVPQSDDSIIINNSLLLNTDFILTGNGHITINHSGFLRGSSFNITILNNGSINCLGKLELNTLSVSGESIFKVGNNGKATIVQLMQNLSSTPVIISGELSVKGTLSCGNNQQQSAITGTGIVSSRFYEGSGYVMNISPCSVIPAGSFLTECNWSGNVSSDWLNPLNWSNEKAPESNSNIAILQAQNSPVISGKISCRNLTLSPGAQMAIMPSSVLHVSGQLDIDGNAELILKNTNIDYASLILDNPVDGKIKSELQVRNNISQLVASPVSDALSGTFLNMYLRPYDEPSANWGSYIVPTDVTLVPMKGYELYSLSSETRYFEGTPNFSECSQLITSLNEGWNLIGNPYPCYLDWQTDSKSLSGWQRSEIASAIYYQDPEGSGNYAVYLPGSDDASINNGSRFIHPMQGFFVKARQAGDLTVNQLAIADDVSASEVSLKNTALKFRIEGNGFSDETMIRVNPAATADFDDDFDAYKLSGNEDAPSLFSLGNDNTHLAVNTLPVVTSSSDIGFGLTCKNEGQFVLKVSGAFNFGYRFPLSLEDRTTQTYIDLRTDSTYVFSHSPNSDPNRFILHFDVASGITQNMKDQPEISYSNGMIRISKMDMDNSTVEVVGMDGKQYLQTKANSNNSLSIPFEGNQGIYLVKITTNTTCHARKIYVQ